LKNTFTDARNNNRQEWKHEHQLLLLKKQNDKENFMKNITNFTNKIDHIKKFKVNIMKSIGERSLVLVCFVNFKTQRRSEYNKPAKRHLKNKIITRNKTKRSDYIGQ